MSEGLSLNLLPYRHLVLLFNGYIAVNSTVIVLAVKINGYYTGDMFLLISDDKNLELRSVVAICGNGCGIFSFYIIFVMLFCFFYLNYQLLLRFIPQIAG